MRPFVCVYLHVQCIRQDVREKEKCKILSKEEGEGCQWMDANGCKLGEKEVKDAKEKRRKVAMQINYGPGILCPDAISLSLSIGPLRLQLLAQVQTNAGPRLSPRSIFGLSRQKE